MAGTACHPTSFERLCKTPNFVVGKLMAARADAPFASMPIAGGAIANFATGFLEKSGVVAARRREAASGGKARRSTV